jgi:hypothetical protein
MFKIKKRPQYNLVFFFHFFFSSSPVSETSSTDCFAYQFYRPCLPNSPDIVTPKSFVSPSSCFKNQILLG